MKFPIFVLHPPLSGWLVLGQRYLLSGLVIYGVSGLPASVLGADEPASVVPAAGSNSGLDREKSTDKETMTEVEYSKVVRFQEWLKQKQAEHDRRMPQVVDLIISPRTSSVLATVEHDPSQEKPWIATLKPVPAEKSPEVKSIAASTRSGEATEKGSSCELHLSAAKADELPDLVVRQIISLEQAPKKLRNALKTDSPVEAAVSLQQLLGRSIRGLDGDVMAKVVDFGIAPKEQHVAYAIVELPVAKTADANKENDTKQGDGTRSVKSYAIPIAAFVQSEQSSEWKIELTAEEVAKQEPLEKGKTPSEISRGWIEYLSVRYGRSTTGGIQPHPANQK